MSSNRPAKSATSGGVSIGVYVSRTARSNACASAAPAAAATASGEFATTADWIGFGPRMYPAFAGRASAAAVLRAASTGVFTAADWIRFGVTPRVKLTLAGGVSAAAV